MVTKTSAKKNAGSTTRGPEDVEQVEQARNGQMLPDGEDQRETRSATLRLPFLTARFEVPRAPRGQLHVGPVTISSPGKAAYYAGLGALAAVEIIEWPIAVAVAAGTYVAQHTRADEPALPHLERSHAEQAHPEQARTELARGEPTHDEPAHDERTNSEQVDSEQAHGDQSESDQSESEQSESEQAGAEHREPATATTPTPG